MHLLRREPGEPGNAASLLTRCHGRLGGGRLRHRTGEVLHGSSPWPPGVTARPGRPEPRLSGQPRRIGSVAGPKAIHRPVVAYPRPLPLVRGEYQPRLPAGTGPALAGVTAFHTGRRE